MHQEVVMTSVRDALAGYCSPLKGWTLSANVSTQPLPPGYTNASQTIELLLWTLLVEIREASQMMTVMSMR
jgi:hypothetical protein